MRKREKLIKEHLKSMEECKKNLPLKYHPIEGVTEIHYGFMGRKTITADEIKRYNKRTVKIEIPIEDLEKLEDIIFGCDISFNQPWALFYTEELKHFWNGLKGQMDGGFGLLFPKIYNSEVL